MRSLRFVVLLGAVACRGPRAAPPATPPPPAAPPAPVVVALPPPPATTGALEGTPLLRPFFAALARLEEGGGEDDVRVVELGDSHVAADWETGPLRRRLQARFGDGGRGFVPVGRPWKAWSQEGVLTGTAGEWSTKINNPAARQPTGDGLFGLAGFALASRQPGARAWTDVLVPTSAVEIAYLEQPGGGTFDLVVDGVRSARIPTRAEAPRSAFHVVSVDEAAPQHHLEIRPAGDGEVRVFGAALDRAKTAGIVVDALGINGARVATPLSWRPEAWAEDLGHRRPALVILAYGTNDAVDPWTSLDAFEAGLGELARRIGPAAPAAACLVLGPPDRQKAPRLPELVTRARRVAAAAQCAFYDRLAAMGGPGSIARWGQADHVHLTREGYAREATALAGDLVGAYELWRRSR